MSGLFEFSGRCHCGNISYRFESPIPKTDLPLRSCDCSFCTKQGAIYTSHPQGRLRVQVADADSIRWYRYGSETAEVLLCSVCGVFPLITCNIDDRLYAALNANSISGLHVDRQRIASYQHPEHDEVELLRRRQENWIGDVEIQENRAPRGIDPSFF